MLSYSATSVAPVHEIHPQQNRFLPVDNGGSDESLSNEALDQISAGKPVALVVDDVEDVTDMLAVFLSHAGFDVLTASSAPAALAIASSKHVDVVVSDIGMPDMSGYQLAQELRRLPEYQNVPMIAVTGFSMYDDQQKSLQSGFNAHLTKPIDPTHLFELIEKLRG